MQWQVIPLGLAAVEIRAAAPVTADLCRRLAVVAAELRGDATARDVLSAYRGIAVHAAEPIDPIAWKERVAVAFRHLPDDLPTGSTHQVEVHYDGPDLDAIADFHGCSPDGIIERHQAPLYTVAAIGFRPDFPYLLGLDPELVTPRLASPRTRVPAGAVGIGGDQTGIYPQASPGGWQLLGRCDPDICAGLAPGDQLRFRAVS